MIRPPLRLLLILLLALPLAGWTQHAVRSRILLIIDDMGHPIADARTAACLSLPREVAFSIIPGTPRAALLAERCARDGRDYLAHLPWEPLRPDLPPERLLMPRGAAAGRLARLLQLVSAELPGMVAANNHQGSRASLDEAFLAAFAAAWRPLGLPFIDSRTVADSRVPRVLGAAGVAVFENRLFLDHVDTDAAIRAALASLETLARRDGAAIAIAHPRPRSLRLLNEWLGALPSDLELVPARAMLSPAPGDWIAQRREPEMASPLRPEVPDGAEALAPAKED